MAQFKVDIEQYLSPSFRPEAVANQLVRETTLAQDSSVDVGPALTRLKYDVQEIEARMRALCGANAVALLEQATVARALARDVDALAPSLEDTTESLAKLERDFLVPYRRAVRLHTAGERLARTVALSRNLSVFLQLALQAQSQEFKREGALSGGRAGSALLRTAHALQALAALVRKSPDLRRLRAVAQFEARAPALRADVVDTATRLFKSAGSQHAAQAKLAALALARLDADVAHIVDGHVRALVGTTVLQLTRNSSSAIELERAFADAQQRARDVRTLNAVAREALAAARDESLSEQEPAAAAPSAAPSSAPSAAASTAAGAGSTASRAASPASPRGGMPPPSTDAEQNPFWAAVATQLEQKLKIMSVANPTALKAMAANRSSIYACTQAVPAIGSVFEKYLGK